jgi:hypothetical protein
MEIEELEKEKCKDRVYDFQVESLSLLKEIRDILKAK